MSRLTTVDLAIVIGYNVAVLALGCGFWRRARSSEGFMAGSRALPGWAVGLSIFGSYISSISFLGNPGKAYAGDWNAFVFALSMPLAAWMAARWFVPFYRRAGAVSAYEHLEHRFGPWARTYAVACFLLLQVTRLGTILYLLALALQPLLGWSVPAIIAAAGVVIIVYPLAGGAEAWIWTGVLQAIWLLGGAAVCVVSILSGMPEGAGQVLRIAAAEDKLSLGSFGWSLAAPTFAVTLVYGLVTHLQNFGIDQSYVQRYIASKTGRDAARSVWMGTWMFLPVSAAFFFIGTGLFAFYRARPELLPAAIGATPDRVFPHFIGTQLPPGLAGIVIAAIAAAAMDSNLTCSATLFLQDIYRRFFRPGATERESMWALRLSTAGFGAASLAAALAMIHVRTALDVWWQAAGIVSGGMLGLFLLGIACPRASSRDAALGVATGVAVILWMTISPHWPALPAALRSPFHNTLVLVFGTAAIVVAGACAAFLRTRSTRQEAPSP